MRKINPGNIELNNPEIRETINQILESGWISEGPKVRKFEKEWAKFIGTKYSILTNSGTSALEVGLEALKIKYQIPNGKKIITTPITYIATSNAIVNTGFQPVYCDVDKEKFLIQTSEIEKILEENDPSEFCGILPVHLMGYACDMDEINRIAKKYSLFVFEDSAQAHGTKYKGKIVGSLGDISDFSFYIAHNIQAGELGAVNTNDIELIRLVRQLKANGRLCNCTVCTRSEGTCPYKDEDFDPRFTHNLIGHNFKTTEFQAAIAEVQLRRVDQIIKKRSYNVKYLNEHLSKFDELQLPIYDDNTSYLAYPLIAANRGKIIRGLKEKGVETRTLFGCIPTQQRSFKEYKSQYENKLPNAEFVGKHGFYFGCHQYLNQEDLEYIVKAFEEVLSDIKK